MLNAASMAYRKASANARDATKVDPNTAPWIKYIASVFPEDDTDLAPIALIEANHHRKERLFANSNDYYEKFAWFIYSNITSTTWFEIFILFNIVIVGVSTGVELENQGRDEWTNVIGYYIGDITLSVFTLECILKLIAEAYEPWRYFTNPEFGMFNTFDFLIVVLSFSFMETGGNAISALRMIRLLRLLSFIKHVPHLRVLVNGLIQGVKSVAYIVLMLFLVIYIFAIFGANVFGANDPGHFGDTAVSMMTLFQVSTLGSWSSIAYISWFGCEGYLDSAYSSENPSRIKTYAGTFEGYKCDVNIPNSSVTCIFWPLYILLTSWVIMSLFIGVISRGMFSTYIGMVNENHATSYLKHHEENTMSEKESRILHGGKPTTLKDKIELIFDKNVLKYQHNKKYMFLNDTLSQYYNQLVLNCIAIRNSSYFSLSITFTILLVGGVTCIQTNDTLSCQRRIDRIHAHHSNNDDDDDVDWKNKSHDCEQIPDYLYFIGLISQLIFTFEAFIKITAEGVHPKQYFTDKEDGYWNCIDFFIVIVGFVELTPFGFIFEHFPIVLLRLLRLLRVFRLAKTLPRLRSIVEALVSGFSSVGWICILFAVFNYIVACICIIIFRENDPFHFGSVSRAMFTIFRIETLDTWDQILYIAMYGCDKYPGGYELLLHVQHVQCNEDENVSTAFGWLGVVVFFTITIVGAYILPVVLIGVVSIKFDNATTLTNIYDEEQKRYVELVKRAKEIIPGFFTSDRLDMIDEVFRTLDSSGEYTLDMNEIAPFFYYSIASMFEVELDSAHFESLFYLLDTNHSSEIGQGEFVTFITVLKNIQLAAKLDLKFAQSMFSGCKRCFDESSSNNFNNGLTRSNSSRSKQGYLVRTGSVRASKQGTGFKSLWDRAMEHVDKDSLDSAWDSILHSINGIQGDNLGEKVANIFKDFDSDGTGELDISELGEGLKSCGIRLNDRQIHVLAKSVDIDGDGKITFEEFAIKVQTMKHIVAENKDINDVVEIEHAIIKTMSKSHSSTDKDKNQFENTEDVKDVKRKVVKRNSNRSFKDKDKVFGKNLEVIQKKRNSLLNSKTSIDEFKILLLEKNKINNKIQTLQNEIDLIMNPPTIAPPNRSSRATSMPMLMTSSSKSNRFDSMMKRFSTISKEETKSHDTVGSRLDSVRNSSGSIGSSVVGGGNVIGSVGSGFRIDSTGGYREADEDEESGFDIFAGSSFDARAVTGPVFDVQLKEPKEEDGNRKDTKRTRPKPKTKSEPRNSARNRPRKLNKTVSEHDLGKGTPL